MTEFQLAIELVPQPLWFINLRNRMGRKAWSALRLEVIEQFDNSCAICGQTGPLECHERWEYTVIGNNAVQRLLGFVPLCKLCHHVKHIGMAGVLAQKGVLNFQDVIEHFLRVNKCTQQDYERHSKEVWQQWQQRSRPEITWTFEYGAYQEYVPGDSND